MSNRNSAAAPIAGLTGGDCALFCSDVHLHAQQPELADWFFAQVRLHAAQASHFFVLGDLFDAWVGDDQADTVSLQALALLDELAQQGVVVSVVHGNRDFLLGSGGAAAPGKSWRLLPEHCVLVAWDEAILLAHGDSFCTDDAPYQAWREQRSTAQWQSEFLRRPLADRLSLAQQMRAQSEREKSDKSQYLMDANLQSVEFALRQTSAALNTPVRRVIHGHTHRPGLHQWAGANLLVTPSFTPCQRWVLPDWQLAPERGGFLRLTRSGFEKLGCWD